MNTARLHAYLALLASLLLTTHLFFSSLVLGVFAVLFLLAAQAGIVIYASRVSRRFMAASLVILVVLLIIVVLDPCLESLGYTMFDVFLFLQLFGWAVLNVENSLVRLVTPLILINLLNLFLWIPIVPGGLYSLLIVLLDKHGYIPRANCDE